MKKSLLLAVITLTIVHASMAQRFKQGVGTMLSVEAGDYMDTKVNIGFVYSPALFFAERAHSSFSVGIPVSFGFNEAFSGDYIEEDGTYDGFSSIGLVLDVPVIINFNFGAGALAGSKERWGFFVGGGYAYHLSTSNYHYDAYDGNGNYYYKDESSTTFGVTGNAGFRIGMGRRHRHNLEFRFSYMKGLTNYKPDVYGFNCIFNF